MNVIILLSYVIRFIVIMLINLVIVEQSSDASNASSENMNLAFPNLIDNSLTTCEN